MEEKKSCCSLCDNGVLLHNGEGSACIYGCNAKVTDKLIF